MMDLDDDLSDIEADKLFDPRTRRLIALAEAYGQWDLAQELAAPAAEGAITMMPRPDESAPRKDHLLFEVTTRLVTEARAIGILGEAIDASGHPGLADRMHDSIDHAASRAQAILITGPDSPFMTPLIEEHEAAIAELEAAAAQ